MNGSTCPELPEFDQDTNDHVVKAMERAGILFTDAQKTELERHLAESMLKRREKEADAQLPGNPECRVAPNQSWG